MEFVCRIGTPEGRIEEEIHQARDARALRDRLEKAGNRVFEIRPKGLFARLSLPALGGGLKRIPMQLLLLFNQELAALLRSGLPVTQALDLMLERQRDPAFRDALEKIRDGVRSGRELSEAFGDFGEMFPPLYAPALKAGERSGDLERVIRRFVRYQRLLMGARQRVVTALVYPAVLVVLSAILIAIMTIYVIPKFEDFFAGLGAELPLITRLTLGFSTFIQKNWLWLLIGGAVAIVFLRRWRRSPGGALVLDRWRLKIPLLGDLFHRMALSEFCRSLSTLLEGGLPVLGALEVSVGAVGNVYVRRKLEPTTGRVREGAALHEALEETEVSTDIVVDMVKVGETTGALDKMLSDVSDFLDEEVEAKLERVVSLLEPIMLVFMGLIVALLLTAVYLPMFNLMGAANV